MAMRSNVNTDQNIVSQPGSWQVPGGEDIAHHDHTDVGRRGTWLLWHLHPRHSGLAPTNQTAHQNVTQLIINRNSHYSNIIP